MKDIYIYLVIFLLCFALDVAIELYNLNGHWGIIIPVGLIQIISLYEFVSHRDPK